MLFLLLNFWLYIRGLHDRPFVLIISKARRRSHESIFLQDFLWVVEQRAAGQEAKRKPALNAIKCTEAIYVFSARAVFHLRYLLSIILQTVKFVRTEWISVNDWSYYISFPLNERYDFHSFIFIYTLYLFLSLSKIKLFERC